MSDADEPMARYLVTLRGSMTAIVESLAVAIAANLVENIVKAVPCDNVTYDRCPLAALLDPSHAAHSDQLESRRLRLLGSD